MVSLAFPPAKCCGSGKFGTPFRRMHWEKASKPLSVAAFCVVVVAAVVEAATLATPGEPLPPPQPAASNENEATVTTDATMSGRLLRIIFVPFSRGQGKPRRFRGRRRYGPAR